MRLTLVIPALCEANVEGSLAVGSFRPFCVTYLDPHPYTKQVSWAWWCVPVVPGTRETEVGGSLEPREAEVAVSWDHATALRPG